MSAETPRNEVRPGEICESCGQRPATQVMLRSGTLEVDASGRVVAEIDPRVAVCQACWLEIVGNKRQLPPARVIARPNRETGKMEPV